MEKNIQDELKRLNSELRNYMSVDDDWHKNNCSLRMKRTEEGYEKAIDKTN